MPIRFDGVPAVDKDLYANPLGQYLDFCDQLRHIREKVDAAPSAADDAEFIILDIMDTLWSKMNAEEHQQAREQAWRAWPEKYKEKLKEMTT